MLYSTYRKSRQRWLLISHAAIILVVVALIAARLYLPYWLKDYVNATLDHIPGYQGSVESIDVHLYRGAYTMNGLSISKVNAGIPVPFIAIKQTDLSLQWRALLRGRVVSDILLDTPVINFAQGRAGAKQTGKGTDWTKPIKALMPIDINQLEITHGKIAFRDFSSKPAVNIFITDLHGTLSELRNTEDIHTPLPSTINLAGQSIGDGTLAIKGKLNILRTVMDMDIDAKLENAKLTAFNSFSNAYAAVDFKGGTMSIYSEMAVKNGQLSGYIKPIIQNLSVDRLPKNSNPFEIVWANVASVLFRVFENQSHDQFATKVPLSGSFTNIETDFWPVLGGVLRNAFVEAFRKGTDNDVSFAPKK